MDSSMTHTQVNSNAILLGEKAFQSGSYECPFEVGTVEYYNWHSGYYAAEEKANSKNDNVVSPIKLKWTENSIKDKLENNPDPIVVERAMILLYRYHINSPKQKIINDTDFNYLRYCVQWCLNNTNIQEDTYKNSGRRLSGKHVTVVALILKKYIRELTIIANNEFESQ